MNEEGKIDYLSPIAIFSFVLAFAGDFAFIFIIGALIPVIGLIILLGVLAMHYFAGVIMGFIIAPKLQHLLPKIVLILAILLPLPTLLLGLVIAILLQNKLIEQLAIQLTIAAVGVVTGGAGAVAGEVVEAGAAAAEVAAAGAETAAAGAEVGAAAKEAGELGEAGAEAAKKGIPPEALGEEKSPFEKLQELTQNTPQEDGKKDEEEEPPTKMNENMANPRRELYHDVENDPEYKRMLQRWEVAKRLRESAGMSPDNVELDDKNNEVNLKKAA